MQTKDRLADRLFDIGFFLVEAFAAMEVTAVLVANARITASLGLREELSSFILNSYLYPLFGCMVLALLLSPWIARKLPPVPYFLAGLGAFAAGNLVCANASTPAAFFAGRAVMGFGGAIAFAGQLWTLSSFHYQRITRPLVWGEVGAALGIVAGPMVGGLFAHHSPEGWRHFFTLNAGLGLLTACFAYAGLRGLKAVAPMPSAAGEGGSGRGLLWTMTTWQVAVSILIVGAEYFFSDHLQAKAGKSPLFVAGMTMLASLGAILGSLWAARLEHSLERLPARAAIGLLASLAVIAACLEGGHFRLAGLPIFGAGLGMGLASVSIYASIVKASRPDQFLNRSMIYLLGMQIGNALGVQAVGFAEMRHLDVLATALAVGVVPLGLLAGALIWGHRPAPPAAKG